VFDRWDGNAAQDETFGAQVVAAWEAASPELGAGPWHD
jgi:hypothetical protein